MSYTTIWYVEDFDVYAYVYGRWCSESSVCPFHVIILPCTAPNQDLWTYKLNKSISYIIHTVSCIRSYNISLRRLCSLTNYLRVSLLTFTFSEMITCIIICWLRMNFEERSTANDWEDIKGLDILNLTQRKNNTLQKKTVSVSAQCYMWSYLFTVKSFTIWYLHIWAVLDTGIIMDDFVTPGQSSMFCVSKPTRQHLNEWKAPQLPVGYSYNR